MPEFLYKAMKVSGQLVEGVLAAETEPALLAELRRMGCFPIQVTQKERSAGGRFYFL